MKAAGGCRKCVDGEVASSQSKVLLCTFVVTDMPADEKLAKVKVSDIEGLSVSQVVTVMVKVNIGQNRCYIQRSRTTPGVCESSTSSFEWTAASIMVALCVLPCVSLCSMPSACSACSAPHLSFLSCSLASLRSVPSFAVCSPVALSLSRHYLLRCFFCSAVSAAWRALSCSSSLETLFACVNSNLRDDICTRARFAQSQN